jgi:hypothetical protein
VASVTVTVAVLLAALAVLNLLSVLGGDPAEDSSGRPTVGRAGRTWGRSCR